MIILTSLICAVLAAWWFVPPPGALGLEARLRTQAPDVAAQRRSRRWWFGVPIVAGPGIATAAALDGGRGAAVVVAVVIALGTVLRLTMSHTQARSARLARRSVTDACTTLASQVRVGRVATEALMTAADDCPILMQARAAHLLGGDVLSVWRTQSHARGCGGLAELARAWQISTQTGAPMAAALERVVDGMTTEDAVRAVVAGELAGPRATGKIMAVLPVLGLAMGYALGGDPVGFLLEGVLGWSCLVGGVALASAGVLWVESLAQRAAVEG